MLDVFWKSTPEIAPGLLLISVMANLVAETLLLRRDLKLYQNLSPRNKERSADAIAQIPGLYLAFSVWGLLLLGFLWSLEVSIERRVSDRAELLIVILGMTLLFLLPVPLFLILNDRLQWVYRRLAPRIQSLLGARNDREGRLSSGSRWIELTLLGAILFSYLLVNVIIQSSLLMGVLFASPLAAGRTRFRKRQLAMLTA